MVEQLAASLQTGDVVEGIVTRTTDFGAFVSLRSPDGNLHGAVVRSLCDIHAMPCPV
jgi:ribosomal protein S1